MADEEVGMDQILSKSEIDALLSGVSEGLIDTEKEAEPENEPEVMAYDLTSQDKVIRGRLSTLDIINDRFSRLFRISLSNALRKMVQVTVESTNLIKFGEFLNYLPIPSCLNIVKLNPLRGSSIIALESKLLFGLLDNFFGGTSQIPVKIEGRDFTAIELMLVQKVIKYFLQDMKTSWQSVFPIQPEYLRTEINPQFVAVVAPNDIVVQTTYDLELESAKGRIHLVIPFSAIEPIKQRLTTGFQSETTESDVSQIDLILEHLDEVEVNCQVQLGETEISVDDFSRLQAGDVIPLTTEVTAPIPMLVSGVPKFLGRPVLTQGMLGLQILEKLEQNVLSLSEAEDDSKS